MTVNAMICEALPNPQVMYGDGTACPGCGTPFFTARSHNAPQDRAVNTGLDIDVFDGGILVLCESCVRTLAEQIGWIDPEQGKARASDVRRHQRREAAIKAAEGKRVAAVQALSEAQAALEDLERELSA